MTFIQCGWEYAENMLKMVFLEYVFAIIILAFNNYSICAKRASIYNHFIVCNNNEYCFIQQISKSSIISKSTPFSNISNTAFFQHFQHSCLRAMFSLIWWNQNSLKVKFLSSDMNCCVFHSWSRLLALIKYLVEYNC